MRSGEEEEISGDNTESNIISIAFIIKIVSAFERTMK